jgi:23S rRNA maturation-related 3'-5' exoribonuclease YhaM
MSSPNHQKQLEILEKLKKTNQSLSNFIQFSKQKQVHYQKLGKLQHEMYALFNRLSKMK